MKKLRRVNFFLVYALLFQAFFVVICTFYHGVIIPVSGPFAPPLTKEYWYWLLDEYVPVVPYEGTLVSLCYSLKWISLVILCLGMLSLLFNARISRRGRLRSMLVLPGGMLAYGLLFLYTRNYGQPYYLFMDMAWVEILSIVFLLMCFMVRKYRVGREDRDAPASKDSLVFRYLQGRR